ncbi:MAG: SirB2 family protein [Mariprofundaceae bacterium]|nr:SirB2 family protein [Mariprofundaceae bacterium]
MMTSLWSLHISFVSLSLLLFVCRGVYMWLGKPIHSYMWKRSIPDIIDSLLLLSGISLAYILGFAPWNDNWLLVKLIAIAGYILFGFLALNGDLTPRFKRSFFILALVTVTYIIFVAHSKSLYL